MEAASITAEIASIRAELDDGTPQSPDAAATREGDTTLYRKVEALKASLQQWRAKREAKVEQYNALMATHATLKRQLGLHHVPVDAKDVDVSTGNLDYLQMENQKLQDEKSRRLVRAEEMLDELRNICREVGEDSSVAAAEVHPALRSLSAEKESAEMLGSVYKLAGTGGSAAAVHSAAGAGPLSAASAAALAVVDSELDLSDTVFQRLADKTAEMERLRVEREAQSRDVLEMLSSLWGVLDIPEEAPERNMVMKMLSPGRPQRLYKRTLDKCMAEVNRLESCRAQAMRDLAVGKARELEQLCISTRISPPNTGQLLVELDRPGASMTGVLTKLVRLVNEVQAMAEKRAPVLGQVLLLQEAAADSAWLRAYNQDADRYKGRDASRNMQRAIRAGKMREKLVPLMEGLQHSLEAWELEEGGPFLYDEAPLQHHAVLGTVLAELEQLAQDRVAPRGKTSGGGAAGSSASKPPQTRPSTAASQGTRNGGGGGRASHGNVGLERPMLTPRNLGDNRRMSLAPPPASARETTTARATSSAMKAFLQAAGSVRVSTQSTAGGSHAYAPQPTSSAASHQHYGGYGSAYNASTPTRRPAASPMPSMSEAAMPSAGGAAGQGSVSRSVKNPAQDLFRHYLGEPGSAARDTARPAATPGAATPGAKAGSPKAKLTFSHAMTPGGHGWGGAVDGDDGVDDVLRAKCDTPKSTATSRTLAHVQSIKSPQVLTIGGAMASPAGGSKRSGIPKLKL